MGISVGAALKKIAVALVSDKKTLKKAAMAILVVIVALLMPMAAIITVFSGTLELDVAALQEQIAEEMSDSDRQMLQQVEDNMNAIQTALREADMASRVKEAQVLYILALYDHSSQPGFVSRLVRCFQPEQTDDQLIAAVNSAFGTNIVTEDFSKLVGNVRSQYVDTSNYVYPTTKNNLDLVQWAIAAEAAGWGYVWGTFGQVLTRDALAAKVAQYPDNVGIYEEYIRSHYLGKRTADCAGFIKGYCWYNPETDSVSYLKPDVKAIVDQIVAELAGDENIRKLYDLWYEQREDVLRTYADTFPERVPLEQNKEFKSIRNAVIQEALKITPFIQQRADAGQRLRTEEEEQPFSERQSPRENGFAPPYPLHYQEETDDKDDDSAILEEQLPANTVDEPVKMNSVESVYIPSAARSVSALMAQLTRLFQEQDQRRDQTQRQQVDRKQRREINEKKQAMGIRD